jgi:hypothetical protein
VTAIGQPILGASANIPFEMPLMVALFAMGDRSTERRLARGPLGVLIRPAEADE